MLDNKTLLGSGLAALAALIGAPSIALADPIPCPAAQAGAPRPDQAVSINPRRNINHQPSVMGIPLYYDSVATGYTPYGGRGWSLAVPRLVVSGSGAQLIEGGVTTTFQLVSGAWVAPAGEPRKLVTTGGSSFELRGNNGTHVLVFQDGRLTEERSAYRTLTEWTYDAAGKLTQVRDPRTNVTTTLTYDTEHRLQAVVQGNLQQTLGYDFNDQLASISLPFEVGGSPAGEAASYGYTAGVMSSATAANGDLTQYTAGADGGLLSVRYPDSYAVVITCESGPAGAVIYRMSDSFHQTIEQTNAAGGQVISTADAYGNTTSYTWNAAGQMTSRSADGQTEQWTYNAAGALLGHTNPLGQTTSYAYSGGRLISETDHLGRTTSYGYDANGFVNAITALGQTTTMVNNAQGDAVQITAPGGLVTTRTINSMGDVTSVTAPGNLTTTYAVSAAGQVTAVQYPDGTSESFTYRPNGQIASATGRDGRTVSYAYDSRDRVVNVALPGGRSIATQRDHLGRPVRIDRNLGTRPQVEERGYGLNGAVTWSSRNGILDQAAPATFAPLGMPAGPMPDEGSGSGSGWTPDAGWEPDAGSGSGSDGPPDAGWEPDADWGSGSGSAMP